MTTSAGAAGPPASDVTPSPPTSSRRMPSPFTEGRPRASWWLRVLAVLLDSGIVALVVWCATGAGSGLATLPLLGTDGSAFSQDVQRWTAGSLLVLGLLQAYTGMTPGKRVAGIAVVDAGSHRPIGLLGTVLRWLAHFLDAVFMIGYLRAGVHPEGRTFADSLLGTVVVGSTRPEPHRWVAVLQRTSPSGAPRPRWPRRLTGGLALVLCAAGAAAWLVQGSVGATGAVASTSCRSTGPLDADAVVETWASVEHRSRLGIERETDRSWSVAAGWSTGQGLPDDGTTAEDLEPTVKVTSPDGTAYSSVDEYGFDAGGYWLSRDIPDAVGTVTGLDVPQDPEGWTVEVMLTDVDGAILAECSAPLPAAPAPDPGSVP
ncbi:RDD family protein [Isoptericola jiangsuensis]|uniref:RDD family protein n=1 Tax=Isoptericola jiangsuensis TaxID=548579 RepID=UPI003AAAF041